MLYGQVDCLDGELKSLCEGKESNRYYLLELRTRALREQARSLDEELTILLTRRAIGTGSRLRTANFPQP